MNFQDDFENDFNDPAKQARGIVSGLLLVGLLFLCFGAAYFTFHWLQ